MEQVTDNSKMPFGKYKGRRMIDVPDEYLLWLHEELEKKCSNYAQPIKNYLDENLEAIKANHAAKYPDPFFNR